MILMLLNTIVPLLAAGLAQVPPEAPPTAKRPVSTTTRAEDSSPDPGGVLTDSPEPSSELAARIDGWIRELADPAFETRERATATLLETGGPAIPALRRTYLSTRDLEVRMRIERIAHEAFMEERLYSRNAFLGISMGWPTVTHAMDPRVPRDGDGIVIDSIVSGTAADDSELRAGDIIVRLDYESFRGNRTVADPRSFSEILRRKGVGREVMLTVLRGREELDIPVTLRARPREYYRRMDPGGFDDQMRSMQEAFGAWWEKWFASPPSLRGQPPPTSEAASVP